MNLKEKNLPEETFCFWVCCCCWFDRDRILQKKGNWL